MTGFDRKKLRSLVSSIFNSLMEISFIGLQNIPETGGYILTTNHMSRLDTPLLFMGIGRTDLSALVTDKYRNNPLFALFVDISESIWINRDIADYKAIRLGLDHIRKGGILGIAPEGTRSRDGSLLPAKSGAVLLAARAGVPVIPVGISGTEDCMKKIRRFQKPVVSAIIGKPYNLPGLDKEHREETLAKNTDEIMCRIAALLPEKYHGFYTSHPRITAILQEQDHL